MTNEEITAVQSDLRKAIGEVVIRANDPSFNDTVRIDNGRVNRNPYLVTRPSSANDVAVIVQYCQKHEIRLTTKSGGHGAAGYCLNSDGMVLDLSKVNSIRTTRRGTRLTAGMGARWIEVYNHLRRTRNKNMVIGGGCGTVGLGGYLLACGYSFISRSYGLASDSVIGMEFIAADGRIFNLNANVTDKYERELYWALKGSGGGNFGIVTKAELELHHTPTERMLMGQIAFPIKRLTELLRFYNSWAPTLPAKMAVYGMIRRFPDPANGSRLTLGLHLNPVYNGRFSDGLDVLKPLLAKQPASVELYQMTLPEWENYVGNGTSLKGRSAYIRSAMLPTGGITDKVADILLQYLTNAPSSDSFVVWTHAGGKIRAGGEKLSCFAHRDAEFVFELKTIWDSAAPENSRANIEWAVDFFDALENHSQGAYLNYIDPLLENWPTKYYGRFYGRLLKVKEHWDPHGRFDFQQGIGSPFSPDRTRPLDLSPLLKT